MEIDQRELFLIVITNMNIYENLKCVTFQVIIIDE